MPAVRRFRSAHRVWPGAVRQRRATTGWPAASASRASTAGPASAAERGATAISRVAKRCATTAYKHSPHVCEVSPLGCDVATKVAKSVHEQKTHFEMPE